MVDVETVILWVHIAAGFLALLGGAVALLTEKGGLTHRRAGRGFVYSMAIVTATAIALYPLGPSQIRLFLVMVAVFSFYFVFTGYRVISRKRPTEKPETVDWGAVVLLILAGLGLLAMGGWWAIQGIDFAAVMLVFGGISIAFGGQDLRTFTSAENDGNWMVSHLQRMIAGYIATVTAVSAVNLLFVPMVVRWLWPTAVGVPLIVYWSRKYE